MSIAHTNAKIILKNMFDISFAVSKDNFQKFLLKGNTMCDDLSIRQLKFFLRTKICVKN